MMEANFWHGSYICQQVKTVTSIIPGFIRDENPARILEIGTGYGGFTKVLRESTAVPIISVDLYKRWEDPGEYENDGVSAFCEFHQSDIFDEEFLSSVIVPYIQSEGKTIIFCDANERLQEFTVLSQYLKSGDCILLHDYCVSLEIFNSTYPDQIWDWCEITENELQGICTERGLVSHKNEELNPIMWGCKQKT